MATHARTLMRNSVKSRLEGDAAFAALIPGPVKLMRAIAINTDDLPACYVFFERDQLDDDFEPLAAETKRTEKRRAVLVVGLLGKDSTDREVEDFLDEVSIEADRVVLSDPTQEGNAERTNSLEASPLVDPRGTKIVGSLGLAFEVTYLRTITF